MSKEIVAAVTTGLIVAIFTGTFGWFFKEYLDTKNKETLTGKIEANRLQLEEVKQHIDELIELQAQVHSVPIGTILPWHKSMEETPSLPTGWLECNGQAVFDEDSPYYQQNVPDLNNTSLFLRGSLVSGERQDEDWKSLIIDSKKTTYKHGPLKLPKQGKSIRFFGGHWAADKDKTANGITFEYDSSEIRPKNFSVVWVIKVK